MANTTNVTPSRDENARVVADIVGKSKSLVQKVKRGDRDNDEVMAALIDYTKEKEKLIQRIKDIQEVYRVAAKTGRFQDAFDLEEKIDHLQEQFEELRKQMLDSFYAG